MKVGRLPSAATAKAFRSELNGMTLLQLADTFGELKKDATLQQDDTSKFHQGYTAFEVCYTEEDGEQRVLTVGLERSWEKTAEGVAHTYGKVLDDVERAAILWKGPAAAKEARLNMVMSTSNTMTDRGAVAKSFASEKFPKLRLRELLRSGAFPDQVTSELGMSEEEFRVWQRKHS